jgi:thiol-disulfide isomerase/thioredoxin
MEQACAVRRLYLTVVMAIILYPAGLAFFAYKGNWPVFALWLVLPLIRWAALQFFPKAAAWRGSATIDDKLPTTMERTSAAPVRVTYYSLFGCPFCPIVAQRLDALQKEMGFTLTKIDLTLKPQLAASKGILSVPVVEVGHDRLVGNVTTEQLAQLIAHQQPA